MTETQTVGKRILFSLARQGKSMRALSRDLQVAQPTVYKWCHDKTEPPISKLVQISGLLNVSLMWLISGESEEKRPDQDNNKAELLLESGVTCRNTDALKYFRVVSDDMDPTICVGDIAIVDRKVNGIEQSGIYLVDVGREVLLRRFTRSLDGSLRVSCDNSERGPGVETLASGEPLKVVGRVISKVSIQKIG